MPKSRSGWRRVASTYGDGSSHGRSHRQGNVGAGQKRDHVRCGVTRATRHQDEPGRKRGRVWRSKTSARLHPSAGISVCWNATPGSTLRRSRPIRRRSSNPILMPMLSMMAASPIGISATQHPGEVAHRGKPRMGRPPKPSRVGGRTVYASTGSPRAWSRIPKGLGDWSPVLRRTVCAERRRSVILGRFGT